MEFLYYYEVQQKLTEHLRTVGEPYSFYNAMQELWEAGACHTADRLPEISAEAWLEADTRELDRLMAQTPVRVDYFAFGFREKKSAKQFTAHKIDRTIRPIRIALDQAIGLHRHTAMEIFCVLRGGATLVTAAGSKNVEENSFCMVAPNVDHDVLSADDSLVITFSLSQQVIEDTLYRMLQQESVLSQFFRDSMGREQAGYLIIDSVYPDRVLPFLRGILAEHYREREYSDSVKEAYLTLLLTHLLRYSGNYCRYEQKDRRGAASVLAILKYIQANYHTISLSEMAAHFHYEPGYMGKLIKRITGKAYTTIVSELRIDEAKRLLLESELSIEEIGERVGFESTVHFSRSFKAALGMAPSIYRKHNRM